MKHFRALLEQASTYLDLVCSVCDLSDETVRATAAKIQAIKTMVNLLYTSHLLYPIVTIFWTSNISVAVMTMSLVNAAD